MYRILKNLIITWERNGRMALLYPFFIAKRQKHIFRNKIRFSFTWLMLPGYGPWLTWALQSLPGNGHENQSASADLLDPEQGP